LPKSIYFSFDDEGEEWLAFAEENKEQIMKRFAEDYFENTPLELFREWFSINGGKTFGHTRLAYYIGYLFFQDQIQRLGEKNAIVAWKEPDFIENVINWISIETKQSL
jgi:hypothetical protein